MLCVEFPDDGVAQPTEHYFRSRWGRTRCWDSTLAGSIKVAILVGLVHGGLLLGAAAPLARLLGANGVTVAPAAKVSATQAASAIAFHVSAVCGAAHFAKKDSKTPLYTILFAGLANCIGDRVLCPLAESGIATLPGIPGIPDAIGAAAPLLATTAAQFWGLGFTLMALKRTKRLPKVWRRRGTGTTSGAFLAFAGPVSQLLWCRIAIYAYVGRCASLLGAAGRRAANYVHTLLGLDYIKCGALQHGGPDLPAGPLRPRDAGRHHAAVPIDAATAPGLVATLGPGHHAGHLSAQKRESPVHVYHIKRCDAPRGDRAHPGGRRLDRAHVDGGGYASVWTSKFERLVLHAIDVVDFRGQHGHVTLVVLGEFQWLVRSMVFSSFVTYGLVTWLRHAGKASIANYWWATVTFTACRLVCNMVGVRTHVRRARVKNLAEYRREKREAELRLRTCPPWFDKRTKRKVPATGQCGPMDIEYEHGPLMRCAFAFHVNKRSLAARRGKELPRLQALAGRGKAARAPGHRRAPRLRRGGKSRCRPERVGARSPTKPARPSPAGPWSTTPPAGRSSIKKAGVHRAGGR